MVEHKKLSWCWKGELGGICSGEADEDQGCSAETEFGGRRCRKVNKVILTFAHLMQTIMFIPFQMIKTLWIFIHLNIVIIIELMKYEPEPAPLSKCLHYHTYRNKYCNMNHSTINLRMKGKTSLTFNLETLWNAPWNNVNIFDKANESLGCIIPLLSASRSSPLWHQLSLHKDVTLTKVD